MKNNYFPFFYAFGVQGGLIEEFNGISYYFLRGDSHTRTQVMQLLYYGAENKQGEPSLVHIKNHVIVVPKLHKEPGQCLGSK